MIAQLLSLLRRQRRPYQETTHRREQLPAYVVRGAEQVHAHPIVSTQVRLDGFAFPAEAGRLQATCDRYLNAPAGGAVQYRAIGAEVFAMYAELAHITSGDPVDGQMGWATERDLGFWIPVAAVKERRGLQVIQRVGWFIPYLLVDEPYAVMAGREAFGFPKQVGTFASERDERGLLTSLCASAGVLSRYSPDTQLQVQPWIELSRIPSSEQSPSRMSLWETVRRRLKSAISQTEGLTLPSPGLLRSLSEGSVPLVFLKQFRHVADPGRACYQAIVEAPARVDAWHGGQWISGDYALDLRYFDSHPVAEELGLGAREGRRRDVVVTSQLAYQLRFDFSLLPGREVWRHPACGAELPSS